MYSNKLAVAIKANGKVLREFEDQVFLPFDTEYSIFIKNKNTVRASVKIEIDGVNVTEGVSLVVNPSDDIELERFINQANLDRGHRFKFIKRSSAIEGHRGIRVDDGLVRVEFQYEKVLPYTVTNNDYQWVQPNWRHDPWRMTTGNMPGVPNQFYNVSVSNSVLSASGYSSASVTNTASMTGITAPGSISTQEFNHVSNFPLESQKHVIILKLLGEHAGKNVSRTVTTRNRTTCTNCGQRSRSTAAKFCSQCGTNLQIID